MSVETPSYADGLLRMIVALGRCVAEGDPEDLPRLLEVAAAVEAATLVAVNGLRAQGHSDSRIAAVAGLGSRQAARARWPRPQVAGMDVVVSDDVPPGVVGFVQPRER